MREIITMIDYESMSDLQLGNAVTVAIHGEEIKGWEVSSCGKYLYHCGIVGDQFNEVEIIDINNPAHVWPIIVENEISIQKDTSHCCEECNEYFTTNMWESDHPIIDGVSCFDSNPLRAAMIVFLKMNG